ncbi:hypothetical protein ACIBU0_26610 [Streptomyces sp. NPDC049627]|uniref:hypothetical protein n=1 Tax=Streptomyces sp. NPDC049627 TaxID=3365595 RepID=UPI0037895794
MEASVSPPPGLGAARSQPALRALAFAELRWTPFRVWSALAQAFGAEGIDEDALAALPRELPGIVEATEGRVRFVDERIADALREETAPSDRSQIHARFTSQLLSLAEQLSPSDGWAASGPVEHYIAHALPAHALQAHRLDEVQGEGRLVAHLDPVALLDAANQPAGAIPNETLIGDAAALGVAGVGSVSQPEWAAWLHLMATARGDSSSAQALEDSGIEFPWRTRWAHWRPPYGWCKAYLRAGSLREITEVEVGGRNAIGGKGQWDRRVRLWDVESGDLIAGPWSDGIPEPGQSEPLWPRDQDNQLAQPWLALNVYRSNLAAPGDGARLHPQVPAGTRPRRRLPL